MSIIVGIGLGSYVGRMIAALVRLLTLLALVLMPLGMTGAPALAAPDHHMTTMAGSGHCEEQQDEAPDQQQMDCRAACTALPAPSTPAPTPALKPIAPRLIGGVAPFTSINLEIATPPPKMA